MKGFLEKEFLLETDVATEIYKKAAKDTPIFDFHCHLNPKEIWDNQHFKNISKLWLGGDHYKWRAMRLHGISEEYITGDKSDFEKFQAWSETVPHLMGNPLYHWTHLELKTYFGITEPLNLENARDVYDECNDMLTQSTFTPQSLIERSNVKFIGTTDDPLSKLEYHQLLQSDESFKTTVAPTFRPDGAMFIERSGFISWIEELAKLTGEDTQSLDGFLQAIQQRIDFFHRNGARASDHDIPAITFVETKGEDIASIFKRRLAGQLLTTEDVQRYQSFFLKELGKMYAEKGWVMQLHIGAMRNNNSVMMKKIGTDSGFDSLGETNFTKGLSAFLDSLNTEGVLPRTVLYNLNPKDNAVLASMMGNFTEKGIPHKVQFGSAWWFNDHIDGMERQIKDFANVGVLGHFIGMLTDSRSFLSYPRHDYFRRILCNVIGEWVEKGLYPNDLDTIKKMIENICFYNAQEFFGE